MRATDPACLQCGARMADEVTHEAWHRGLIELMVALVRDGDSGRGLTV